MGASCPGPENLHPARAPGTGLRVARWPEGELLKDSEPRRTCLDVTRCKGWALNSRSPRRQGELSASGGSRTLEEAGASPEIQVWGTCGGGRARTHEAPAASGARPSRPPRSQKDLPARAPQPCAPSRVSAPTIKATIETFPKRAIYLLSINRSAVIEKSMWPGWASRSRGGKGASARRPRGGRGRVPARERSRPGHTRGQIGRAHV